MKTAEHIGYLLILLACLAGVVWFVISTIADAGRKLTGCKHLSAYYVSNGEQTFCECFDCDTRFPVYNSSSQVNVTEFRDPTIPDDEPAKLRVIRGGKGGN
jgi:hypothetical protein